MGQSKLQMICDRADADVPSNYWSAFNILKYHQTPKVSPLLAGSIL